MAAACHPCVRRILTQADLTAPGGREHAPEPAVISPLEPHIAFAELSRIRPSDTDLPAVLSRVAELAKQTLPSAAQPEG